MQKYIPLAFEINLRPEGFVCDVGSLIEALCGLHDQRDARGVRYTVVTVLVFTLLAKLAGESQLRGIAQWVRLRQMLLAEFLALAEPQTPHASTYSRILEKDQLYLQKANELPLELYPDSASTAFHPFYNNTELKRRFT